MGLWSIGPIRGQYQPESFVESQKTMIEDIEIFGSISILLVKGWNPREVTFSFIVDGMCDPDDNFQTWSRQGIDRAGGSPGPRASDPEAVWDEIQRMQRLGGGAPIPITVNIPGWRGALTRSNADGTFRRPLRAIISDSSITRTHIRGAPSRAVRAVISVTLREADAPIGTGGGDAAAALGRAEFLRGQQEEIVADAEKQAETQRDRQ
jgi:hypothetical protein